MSEQFFKICCQLNIPCEKGVEKQFVFNFPFAIFCDSSQEMSAQKMSVLHIKCISLYGVFFSIVFLNEQIKITFEKPQNVPTLDFESN